MPTTPMVAKRLLDAYLAVQACRYVGGQARPQVEEALVKLEEAFEVLGLAVLVKAASGEVPCKPCNGTGWRERGGARLAR